MITITFNDLCRNCEHVAASHTSGAFLFVDITTYEKVVECSKDRMCGQCRYKANPCIGFKLDNLKFMEYVYETTIL